MCIYLAYIFGLLVIPNYNFGITIYFDLLSHKWIKGPSTILYFLDLTFHNYNIHLRWEFHIFMYACHIIRNLKNEIISIKHLIKKKHANKALWFLNTKNKLKAQFLA